MGVKHGFDHMLAGWLAGWLASWLSLDLILYCLINLLCFPGGPHDPGEVQAYSP